MSQRIQCRVKTEFAKIRQAIPIIRLGMASPRTSEVCSTISTNDAKYLGVFADFRSICTVSAETG